MWAFPEIRTLGQYPEYWARHDPQRTALRTKTREISFKDLDIICDKVASYLILRGTSRDTLIGIMGKNSFDFYFALFGTARTEAGLVVYNWRLSPAELAVQITDSDAKLIIIERECEPLWRAMEELLSEPPVPIWIDNQMTLEMLVAEYQGNRASVSPSLDDVAFQLYTSGTTGRPKGVMLTHGSINFMRLCEHLEPAYNWFDGDSFVNGLPNFHLLHIGIAIQCIYNGVAIDIVRQFEAGAILDTVHTLRSTLITLTPTMLQMLLDHPASDYADLSSLRMTLYSGSPISLGLIKRAIGRLPGDFMQFYGSTEAGGALSLLRPSEHNLDNEEKLRSCGRPLPLIEFKIVDSGGHPVADGEPGELLVRAPSITKGYWRQPRSSREAITDGWYRTGDIAKRDEEGLYYIVDRAKDMIVSGGENIYSAEIENILSLHPDVAAVAVIGVPDDRWGECVKAVVIQRQGSDISDASLIEYCRGRLASYKVPKSVDFVDAFPLVPSGKVSKRELREPYWRTHERSVG